MPTDPTPRQYAEHFAVLGGSAAVVLVITLAVLAPQSLMAVGMAIIACCQVWRLL